jgi:RND superfamily putative drug exporter
VAVTGLSDLYDSSGWGGTGVVGEIVLGSVGALVVLALVFGSFVAAIPLIVAVVSIPATFLALGALTALTPISQLADYLVSLIGLGIAIDYSLLVVARWREERLLGADSTEAVVAAMTAPAGPSPCGQLPSPSDCFRWWPCLSRSCAASATPGSSYHSAPWLAR